MTFAHPAWLLLALAIPPWVWLSWRAPASQTGPRLRHPGLHTLPETATGASPWPIVLQALAFTLFIVAAAQPREPGPWIQPPALGREIALVVDTSLTMSLEDFQRDGQGISRMAVLRQVLGDFVSRRSADRISLSVFGSQAALLTPPTFDRVHVQAQLRRLQVGVLGDNTALGDALGLALAPMQSGPLRPALVLVSDGEPSNAGDMTPAEAVAVARQLGVAIHTLQVGPPPRAPSSPATPPADAMPQPTLEDIARLTGGGHWQVRSTADAAAVMQAIDQREPTLAPPAQEREHREWFPLPLALGLLSLALAQALAARGRQATSSGTAP